MSRYVIGYVTCASRSEARKLARVILAKKLAACVNILDGVESHYWWQGKIDRAKECLLMIKTTSGNAIAVMQTVKANHSYDVPEIIFTRAVAGERRYLKWIASSVAALVLAALTAEEKSGSNGSRMAGIPVMLKAPRVVPWYAYRRLITLRRCGWPMLMKYWIANFHADSTASPPPVVKNTR